MHILVVEDDPAIASSLTDSLRASGYTVDHAATGQAAVAEVASSEPDLILLDLGLPDIDGYDVCRQVRARSSVPIIVLTARGEELDRVLGLELGADDYVVKPFGYRELIARIRAVTRRTVNPSAPSLDGPTADQRDRNDDGLDERQVLIVGALHIDRRTHRVTLDGSEIALTPKEFDLLAMLAADAGAVHNRTDIIERVWDTNWFGPTKTIDAHIAGIRKKLGDPRWIEAVRGVGFRLEQPE